MSSDRSDKYYEILEDRPNTVLIALTVRRQVIEILEPGTENVLVIGYYGPDKIFGKWALSWRMMENVAFLDFEYFTDEERDEYFEIVK